GPADAPAAPPPIRAAPDLAARPAGPRGRARPAAGRGVARCPVLLPAPPIGEAAATPGSPAVGAVLLPPSPRWLHATFQPERSQDAPAS
ncbi:hypothetical protein ACF1DY_17105, partial [Streptomyces albus]